MSPSGTTWHPLHFPALNLPQFVQNSPHAATCASGSGSDNALAMTLPPVQSFATHPAGDLNVASDSIFTNRDLTLSRSR